MCHECLFVWIDIDQAIPACKRKYVSASYVCPAGWLVLALAVILAVANGEVSLLSSVVCVRGKLGSSTTAALTC